MKIRSPHLNVAKAEIIIHKRRAATIFKKAEKITKTTKNNENKHVLGVSIDYKQNLPLPKIQASLYEIVDYRRLQIILSSCVYNLEKGTTAHYPHQEGQAYKDPNKMLILH